MKELPVYLQTREDWLNAYAYAKAHPKQRPVLKERLEGILRSRTAKVLKPGVQKPAEELTIEDFEDQEDPSSPFALSGLGEREIESMLKNL